LKTQTENELFDLVINWVRKNNLKGDLADVAIAADTNLLETGLLDSFGLVDLILFIENQSGCKIDLTDVDPEQFSVVKGLCQLALGKNRG
jgi:acyl carrier protein